MKLLHKTIDFSYDGLIKSANNIYRYISKFTLFPDIRCQHWIIKKWIIYSNIQLFTHCII